MIGINLLRRASGALGRVLRRRAGAVPCPRCGSRSGIVLDSRFRKRAGVRRRVVLCRACGTRYAVLEPASPRHVRPSPAPTDAEAASPSEPRIEIEILTDEGPPGVAPTA